MTPIIAITALFALTAPAKPAGAPSWLHGCWVAKDGAVQEHWVRADDHYAFGHNVVRRDGDIVFFEHLRIEAVGERAVFFAYPAGQGPTTFTESTRTDATITFENPDHDDPQVISYARQGAALTASVSLLDGSRLRQWTYFACPTNP
ncbi:MAG: DUF6265 family protein [Pseudomonadota bacterium]